MIQMINPSTFTFIFRGGNYKRTFKSKSLLLKKHGLSQSCITTLIY